MRLTLVERQTHFSLALLSYRVCFVVFENWSCLSFVLPNRKNSLGPVCSPFSKESRWEMVQRSCNIQLQRWVEKADARTSDVSPSWPMTEMVRSKVVHPMSDLKEVLFLAAQISRGNTLHQYHLETASVTSSLTWNVVKENLLKKPNHFY